MERADLSPAESSDGGQRSTLLFSRADQRHRFSLMLCPETLRTVRTVGALLSLGSGGESWKSQSHVHELLTEGPTAEITFG